MKVYQGNGAPVTTTYGNVGDYYLDLNTDKMYKCVDIVNHGLDRQFLTMYDSHPDRTEYVWESNSYGIKDFSYFCGAYEKSSSTVKMHRLDEIAHIDTSCGTTFRYMFLDCTTLTSIPELDTSNGTDFGRMFYGCTNLTSIPELDTSNGMMFYGMFYKCAKLESIPELDTSNGTNFYNMFYGCTKLTSIPELDTSNGTNFSEMFYGCTNLTSIPELDTSNGTNFSKMFYGCTKLTSIPELDTSNGTNFSEMFRNCTNLTSIPELDTSNGTSVSYMFYSCTNLTSIPKLDSNKSTSLANIFYNCKALAYLRLYNIRVAVQIGSGSSYGHLLDVDSLVHTIKELCKVSSSTTLTMGTTNKGKIANLYCKIVDDTTEKLEMELCESTDANAMTLEEYAAEKGWTIA